MKMVILYKVVKIVRDKIARRVTDVSKRDFHIVYENTGYHEIDQ